MSHQTWELERTARRALHREAVADRGAAMKLDELLSAYWEAAYAEGKEGRDHDTEDGVAQRTLSAIHREVAAMVKAERAACAMAYESRRVMRHGESKR